MDSEKSINSFELEKKNLLPDYLLNNSFVYQFVYNFLPLWLCKVNVLDVFDTADLFEIFVILRNTEILIVSNLGMYVLNILNRHL